MVDRGADIVYGNGRTLLIGLLSDTHIPDVTQELPPELMDAFQGVNLILHAGDIYSSSVLDDLTHTAPVLAARGDDDGEMSSDKRVKDKHVLELEGKTLWLVHEKAYYIANPFSSWWQRKTSLEQDKYDRPDIVVFGHLHRTVVQRVDNVLLVNPGSATFPRYVPKLGTVALLNINSDEVDVRIVQL